MGYRVIEASKSKNLYLHYNILIRRYPEIISKVQRVTLSFNLLSPKMFGIKVY